MKGIRSYVQLPSAAKWIAFRGPLVSRRRFDKLADSAEQSLPRTAELELRQSFDAPRHAEVDPLVDGKCDQVVVDVGAAVGEPVALGGAAR
eukprot:6184885-Pleurochrysis_carterae.AAC.2